MNIYDKAVNKLVKKWYTSVNAEKIITKAFQKSGIFAPGTQKFTQYWEKRNTMSPEERAITRQSKWKWHPASWYKYDKKTGRAVLKNQYK